MDMEYLKAEIAKVIFPSENEKGEVLECKVKWKADAEGPESDVPICALIGTYPYEPDNDDDHNWYDCDEPDDLLRMCDPNDEKFDFYIIAFEGEKAAWSADDGVEPDWVVYYNKEFGTLLQMVLGSGSNLADDDGQYINGVFVPFDRDIVGSCYTAPEGFDPENHGEIDGSCDGELTLDGKALEQQEYLDQWVGYEQKMGRMGTKDCLIGYLDLNGARWGLDDWILVAKG
jgi:hypothetical protein